MDADTLAAIKHALANPDMHVDSKTYRAWLEELLRDRDALRKFYDAWVRCDGTRGMYSCTPAHDSRCSVKPCVCGSDALTAAENEIQGECERDVPREIPA